MMEGKIKYYNWNDIKQLIYADCGVPFPAKQREMTEMKHFPARFTPPESDKDTIITVEIFDKPFSQRLKEHGGD